jgi:predicted lactoylglutathione lyase
MEVALEKVYVDVPVSDLTFFKQFADKMGWKVNVRKNL